ncbi:MAG: trimeric autotransporter adhesin [Patescibacteria group bacterium]|nr:trimeric autotransporter adhesin [Patescibacteria group bacterium]
MQNKRQVFTWPISLLIVVVSFLSVLVVLQQVQAAWVEPNYLPEATNPNSFVFNPLAENLDLGVQQITKTTQPTFVINPGGTTGLRVGGTTLAGNFDGNVNITGDLTVSGDINGSGGGGGGGASSADWAILNGALYYTTTTGSGNVGIGTNNPSHRLHILATASNSELDLQTGGAAGDGTHWGIYHANSAGDTPASSNDLRFWKGGLDRVTFTNTGEVGIGTVSPNKLLHLYSTSPNAELDIQSTSAAGSHWGIYHDGGTDQLRFWKSAGNNVLTLGANGRVGVGTTPDNSNMLRTTTATAGVVGLYGENSSIDMTYMVPPFTNVNPNNVGVKGVGNNNYAGGTGVSGLGFYGVSGIGMYGLYGEATSGGTGLWAKQGSGTRAALLQGRTDIEGDLVVTGNIQMVGSNNFLYVTYASGVPSSAACLANQSIGKIYLDYTNFRLYVCTGTTGWKSTLLN